MARLPVAQLGNPVLVRRAEPVSAADLAGPELQILIDDMIETMYQAPGVGLAAPQVSRSLRLFVIDPGGGEPGEELRVLVNPELEFPGADKLELWEGCLSIPGLRGRTERHATVDVSYLDRNGRACRERFEDFAAAVVQHENDHLDGVFFFSRMPDLGALAFEEEYLRWHAPEEEPGSAPANE
jgi:peptide deformylase